MKRHTIGYLIAALALACGATAASAQPTYLTCKYLVDGTPMRIDYTVNETAGTASIHIVASGHSRTVLATFTPDRVLIDEPEVRWTIDRTTLQVSRNIKLIDSTIYGQCEVQAVPARAF